MASSECRPDSALVSKRDVKHLETVLLCELDVRVLGGMRFGVLVGAALQA